MQNHDTGIADMGTQSPTNTLKGTVDELAPLKLPKLNVPLINDNESELPQTERGKK